MRTLRVVPVIALVLLLLVVPGAAVAQSPTTTTNAASKIGSTSATLNGTVNPNKESTTVSFQYGTTIAYGSTAGAGMINGNGAKAVSASISGLTPSTLYHFRVTATNASGQSFGQDMTFTTAAPGSPPLTKNNGASISASPGTVTWGRSTVLAGKVTGPKGGGVQVVLQALPYPFKGPYKPTGQVTNTGSNGHYSFTVAPRIPTRYEVVAKTTPPAISAAVTVSVRYAVSFVLSTTVVHRGRFVRFFGSVRPAANGRLVFIQRLTSRGFYRTVATAVLHATTISTRSSYTRRVRIFATGVYRVHIRGHIPYSASNSRSRKVTAF